MVLYDSIIIIDRDTYNGSFIIYKQFTLLF